MLIGGDHIGIAVAVQKMSARVTASSIVTTS